MKEKIIRFFTGSLSLTKRPSLLYHKEKQTETKLRKRNEKKKMRRTRENYQRRNLLRQKKTEGILYKSYNLSVRILILRLNNTRLAGATIYPTDLDFRFGETSAYHPWLCSLRTRGFRGRHRCGLTLLSGPTDQTAEDPWVIVGAAHCNYICKDDVTGVPLETCCCRPMDNPGSCISVGMIKTLTI